MTDTPPDWVLLEAAKRSELSNDTPRQRAILFDTNPSFRALCGMILEHEDFKQKVSDALLRYHAPTHVPHGLQDLIIPAPKPDPLVDAAKMMGYFNTAANAWAEDVRAALDALGFEIREKDDD